MRDEIQIISGMVGAVLFLLRADDVHDRGCSCFCCLGRGGYDSLGYGPGGLICSALALYDFHAEKIADICCDGTVGVLRLFAYAPLAVQDRSAPDGLLCQIYNACVWLRKNTFDSHIK